MAQLVRAPPCHGGGRGFESHPGRMRMRSGCNGNRISGRIEDSSDLTAERFNHGILAQLGEHLPYKQRVIGSSPIGPTDYGWNYSSYNLPAWRNWQTHRT